MGAMMTCKEFQTLMYFRDDELDRIELSELNRHKADCAACAAEYSRVQFSRNTARMLSHRPPRLNDPLILINSVVARIEREALHEEVREAESVLDRCLLLLSAPWLRGTMAGLLLLITVSFAVEYTTGVVTTKGFEETIAQKTSQLGEGQTAAGVDQGILLNAAAGVSKLITGKRTYVDLSDNWVMIDKQSLEQLFLTYNELKDKISQLPPEFRAANPALVKLLETKQEAAQVDLVLKDRQLLIRELNGLLPQERRMP
jgi:hypothetical protein